MSKSAKMIELECNYCSEKFPRLLREHKKQLKRNPNYQPYCSDQCRKHLDAEIIHDLPSMVEFSCEQCGKQSTQKRCQYLEHRNHFCSVECQVDFSRSNVISNSKEIVCIDCGNIAMKHRSSPSKRCDDCITRRRKMQDDKKNAQTKEFECKMCGSIGLGIRRSNQQYCDDCRPIRMKRVGRKGGIKSAEKQSRRSKNEIHFANLCIAEFSNIATNERFFTSKYGNWDADVILHDEKIAVLWNGIWHYQKVRKKHSLAQVQARDKIKMDVIVDNGYEVYVIKDMGNEDPDFVREQFEIFKAYVKKRNDIK